MKSSLRCITTLFAKRCNCSSGRKPYLLQPEWENICRSWDGSFSSSSFPGRVYAAGLGTAAALGGTVAVVSPALPSANESAAQGGREDFCGPPPSPYCPLPFRAKWKAASGYTTNNHSVYPENDPGSELGFYYSSGGDNDSNSWESFLAGRKV